MTFFQFFAIIQLHQEKKGKQKMNVMIIDTETANGLDCPLPYDIGYKILNVDTKETLINRSFVIAEIFLDKELMASAYYAEKVPKYWKDIKCGRRLLKSLFNVRKQIFADMKNYNVTKVGGYNMGFDKRATNNDIRFCSGSFFRWFFPYNTEFFDIWNMACSSSVRPSLVKALRSSLGKPPGKSLRTFPSVTSLVPRMSISVP